jgi:hypothetical protein
MLTDRPAHRNRASPPAQGDHTEAEAIPQQAGINAQIGPLPSKLLHCLGQQRFVEAGDLDALMVEPVTLALQRSTAIFGVPAHLPIAQPIRQ